MRYHQDVWKRLQKTTEDTFEQPLQRTLQAPELCI